MASLSREPRWSLTFLRCTGLYFQVRGKRRRIRRFLRITLAICLTLVVTIVIHSGIYNELSSGKDPTVGTLLHWLVLERSLVTMLFFLYWQYSGQFRRLVSLFSMDFPSFTCVRTLGRCDRSVVVVYLLAVVLRRILTNVAFTVYALVTFGIQTVYDDSGINQLDGVYSAFLILNPVETYYICAADVIMCFQVVISLSLRSVFANFNETVKCVSLEQPSDETPQKLRSLMQTQVYLLGLLKTADDILGPHTLIRLALAVPRTVYAVQEIDQVLDARFRVGWLAIVRVVSNVVASLTDLIALTLVPAAVASAMSVTEKILVRSAPFWELRNEELDRVVTLFLLQLRQSGRGLSAGGLVTITNRLILTIGSLVVSYLTIIRRLEASNGGFSRAMNETSK